MSGGVRLFLSEANTHETLIASIRRLIEKAMNTDGDFNDGSVDPAIRQVTWVDLSPSRVEEQGGEATTASTTIPAHKWPRKWTWRQGRGTAVARS